MGTNRGSCNANVEPLSDVSTAQPARPPPQRLVTVLAVVDGVFLVLLCSYIPTTFVGATVDIREGAGVMVGFFSVVLLLTTGASWIATRAARWRAAARSGLETTGRSGVRRVMYAVAGSAVLATIYGAALAVNPSADWRYGIYLITTVLPMLVMAVVAIVTVGTADADSVARYEKTLSNLKELSGKTRKVIALAIGGDDRVSKIVEEVIYIPQAPDLLLPILEIVPLQLFAYHMAVLLGRNVDNPRSLAKAVVND